MAAHALGRWGSPHPSPSLMLQRSFLSWGGATAAALAAAAATRANCMHRAGASCSSSGVESDRMEQFKLHATAHARLDSLLAPKCWGRSQLGITGGACLESKVHLVLCHVQRPKKPRCAYQNFTGGQPANAARPLESRSIWCALQSHPMRHLKTHQAAWGWR